MEQTQQIRRAVLVVEDDAELRRFAARLLEDGELVKNASCAAVKREGEGDWDR